MTILSLVPPLAHSEMPVEQVRQYCPIFDTSISGAECWNHSQNLRLTEGGCSHVRCKSPFSACGACLFHNTVSQASLISDPVSALCNFHAKFGFARCRIKPLEPPKPGAEVTGATIAFAIHLKIIREGMTIPEIAEEIGMTPRWVREAFKAAKTTR